MSASLQITLWIGELRTCFKAYDEVKLILKNGTMLKGTILPMNNTRFFEINTENGVKTVYPDDIEDYMI